MNTASDVQAEEAVVVDVRGGGDSSPMASLSPVGSWRSHDFSAGEGEEQSDKIQPTALHVGCQTSSKIQDSNVRVEEQENIKAPAQEAPRPRSTPVHFPSTKSPSRVNARHCSPKTVPSASPSAMQKNDDAKDMRRTCKKTPPPNLTPARTAAPAVETPIKLSAKAATTTTKRSDKSEAVKKVVTMAVPVDVVKPKGSMLAGPTVDKAASHETPSNAAPAKTPLEAMSDEVSTAPMITNLATAAPGVHFPQIG